MISWRELAAAPPLWRLGSGSALRLHQERGTHAPSPPSKLDRIAISTWSLHNYFRATRDSDFDLPGPMLALLDFPEMIVDRYKVRHFEFCATHFPSTEPAYLREIKYALVHTRLDHRKYAPWISRSAGPRERSPTRTGKRAGGPRAVKQWVDIAHTLGVKSVQGRSRQS